MREILSKVSKIGEDFIEFNTGEILGSEHDQDCCECHWLSFKNLKLDDFENMEFVLSEDKFFRKVEDYGIALIPVSGWEIRIPGYGSNNGYYSSDLTLVLRKDGKVLKSFDISECQKIL